MVILHLILDQLLQSRIVTVKFFAVSKFELITTKFEQGFSIKEGGNLLLK